MWIACARSTVALVGLAAPFLVDSAAAQDVEPRFIQNAPVGSSGLGLAYAYSSGAVLLNKTIPVQNVDGRINSLAAVYALFLDFWGMSGRVDAAVQVATGTWDGQLLGQDTATTRTGLGDPGFRVAMFFVGAPALSPAEYRNYDSKTVVGAAFRVRVPLGQYNPERLINLGANRWTFSPRVGVSQKLLGAWTIEFYTSTWFSTENTDAFGGTTVSQAPIFSLQLHVEHSFRPGLWMALSTRQVFGGKTTVDGVRQDDAQTNNRVGITLNLPISRHNVLRFAFTTALTTSTGNDYNSFYATWLYDWILE